jgi:hypothetical protein
VSPNSVRDTDRVTESSRQVRLISREATLGFTCCRRSLPACMTLAKRSRENFIRGKNILVASLPLGAEAPDFSAEERMAVA